MRYVPEPGLASVLGGRGGVPEQQGRGRFPVGDAGEPDRRAHLQLDAVDDHRRRQGLDDTLRDELALARMQHLGEQQRELVAAEPRCGVGAAEALVQAPGDLDRARRHPPRGRAPR